MGNRTRRLDRAAVPSAEQPDGKIGQAADQQKLQEQAKHAAGAAEAAGEAAAEYHAEQAGAEHAAHQAGDEGIARKEAAGLRCGRRRRPSRPFAPARGVALRSTGFEVGAVWVGGGRLVGPAAAAAGIRARAGARLGQ